MGKPIIPPKHTKMIGRLDSMERRFKTDEQRPQAFLQKHSQVREDGWSNVITGLGKTYQDKRRANVATWELVLPETVAEDLYAGDPTARRIVELLPNEATRQWIEYEDEEANKETTDETKRLQVKERVQEAWIYARLHGGAGILINDGTPTDRLYEPLDLSNLKQVKSLTTLTRWELWAWATDVQRDITKPDFGMPKIYHMYPRMAFGHAGIDIHASRLVRFDGRRLPRMLHIRNNFWGDSVLTPLYEILGDFKTSHQAVAHVIQDYRVLVAKLKGLATSLGAPGGDAKVQQRIATLTQIRSMFGMAVIDSEDSFEFYSAKLEGLDDLLEQVKSRLQAETDIPHTIMFNESPSGLGATGNSEERVWYNHVKSQQENYLRPRLSRIHEVIASQKQGPVHGKSDPKKWAYKFPPLWQMDSGEQAKADLAEAQADDIYYGLGVKTPKQIQEDRFPELVDESSENLAPPQPVVAPSATQPKPAPKK